MWIKRLVIPLNFPIKTPRVRSKKPARSSGWRQTGYHISHNFYYTKNRKRELFIDLRDHIPPITIPISYNSVIQLHWSSFALLSAPSVRVLGYGAHLNNNLYLCIKEWQIKLLLPLISFMFYDDAAWQIRIARSEPGFCGRFHWKFKSECAEAVFHHMEIWIFRILTIGLFYVTWNLLFREAGAFFMLCVRE